MKVRVQMILKYYDDDWYNGKQHHHYHSHKHSCTVTTCEGPGCSMYYGGMSLVIVCSILVLADWGILCGCEMHGNHRHGNWNRNGLNGHNLFPDRHHRNRLFS